MGRRRPFARIETLDAEMAAVRHCFRDNTAPRSCHEFCYVADVVTKTPDRVGQTVGQRYDLLQVIGRGGQGMVYRAFDRWVGRAVAVKVLSSKAARDPQMVERLMREQQALTVLKGTAAVELFDVCRGVDGELCLVMELLSGVDLDEYLYSLEERRERLSLKRVAEIFEPIVDTLEAAHAAGILHRDLKPANIFMLEGGNVRLLDFGMARLKNAAPLTAAGTAMGSPSFMAPEAWKGVTDLLDQRVDVYSLGVILFRVLAGQLPFSGDTLKDKFVNATSAARPSLQRFRPDLPSDIDQWVELALAADRDRRFQNVRALWNVFLSVLHLPSSKRPSFWAAAKGAVQRAFSGPPAPPPAPVARSAPPGLPGAQEPSFMREALAKSMLHMQTPTDLGLDEQPEEPKTGVERTLSMSDADIAYELTAEETAPASGRPKK